jgi:hypothetical protein
MSSHSTYESRAKPIHTELATTELTATSSATSSSICRRASAAVACQRIGRTLNSPIVNGRGHLPATCSGRALDRFERPYTLRAAIRNSSDRPLTCNEKCLALSDAVADGPAPEKTALGRATSTARDEQGLATHPLMLVANDLADASALPAPTALRQRTMLGWQASASGSQSILTNTRAQPAPPTFDFVRFIPIVV